MIIRLLLLSVVLLAGCSKKSPEPEFYVTATVDGNLWIANVANSQNTPVAAIISQNMVVVIGSKDADNAITSLGVVFPKSIALNQAIAFNPAKNLALAYSISPTEGYSADPAKGGSGTLTITRFDETAGVVEGTFSGEAIFNKNSSRVSITNGRFRSAIYKVNVTTPQPGKR
jgi:hypothetical protein